MKKQLVSLVLVALVSYGAGCAETDIDDEFVAVDDQELQTSTAKDSHDDGVWALNDAKDTADGKVDICHFTAGAKSPYKIISVSTSSLPTFEAKGDFVYDNCCVDADCPSVDTCTPGQCVQGTCNVASTCDSNATCSNAGSCSCNDGYSGDGMTCNPASPPPSSCPQIVLSEPGCFWMENYSGSYCWIRPQWIAGFTEAHCFLMNSCGPGGGASGGGCYKWATTAY